MSDAKVQKGSSTILWWIGWILLTSGSFFVSCWLWTWFIANHFGSIREQGVSALWVAAVFGTWMVFLVPLIIVMYNKVDKAYEDARIRREAMAEARARSGMKVRCQWVEESERLLAENLRKKLKKIPETIKGGHLVTVRLKDGREIGNVFVADRREVAGVYGLNKLSFDVRDITDLEPMDLNTLTPFSEEGWLRLDRAEEVRE